MAPPTRASVRFLKTLVERRVMGRPATLMVSYMVTARCNRHCDFCVLPEKSKELDLATFTRILDELVAEGLTRMGFTGGEALLHPEVGEMLGACRERGVMTVLSTNGDLVARRPERTRYADVVSISIDGDREIHDRYRGKGSYDNVLSAFEALRARGQKFITSTILYRRNIGHVEHILDLARRWDIGTVWQPYFANNLNFEPDAQWIPSREELSGALALLREAKRAEPRRVLFHEGYFDFIEQHYPGYDPAGCPAGRLFWAMSPTGRMFTCYPMLDQGEGYDLVKGSVREMLARPAPELCTSGCFCSGHVQNRFILGFRPDAWLDALVNID